jgi:GNAT superfamily N-acetyltransferase
MTVLVYADCDLFAFIEELKELFPLHYEELCVTKDFPLVPDYDAYKRLANAGMLRCITVRADEELIGYIIFVVQPHLHYMTCKTAFEDIYYIHPDFRKGRVGIRLFKYAEEVLRSIGVNRVIMHTKIHMDNSKLFEYLGYKWTDKLFTKIL